MALDRNAYQRLSATGIARAVRSREVSAYEAVAAALERAADVEPRLRAFVALWPEEARARAREVDRRVAAGEAPPLAGVPFGVKGPRGLLAAAARRLVEAGCVPVGATSVPGTDCDWQTWGQGRDGVTVNPWRSDRTPGGSSAGAAAAVAAGVVPLANGSDGAGSVRIPAAWCGLFGLKLTRGALPSPDRTRLAVPGVLVRHAADLEAYVRCARVVPEYPALPGGAVRAVWSADLGFASPEPEVAGAAREAAARFEEAGLLRFVRPEEPVRLRDPVDAWMALRGRAHGAGTSPSARREVNDERLARLFGEADVLVTPATPNPAHGHEGPGDIYSTALTWAFNLSGHPALSLPTGHRADGCPVGVQLVTRHGGEPLLAALARRAEAAECAGMPAAVRTPAIGAENPRVHG
ncbi:amidase [Streptomyces sp. ODS28]|uniref:amidase n=1 Tax=Streptomyces sp. ODS28 TaxID=3136688 RepID=UPI0031F0D474